MPCHHSVKFMPKPSTLFTQFQTPSNCHRYWVSLWQYDADAHNFSKAVVKQQIRFLRTITIAKKEILLLHVKHFAFTSQGHECYQFYFHVTYTC